MAPTTWSGPEVDRRTLVLRALDVVIDPELDEPITDLGFVHTVDVDGYDVEVHLRLPTSFCAPNFAYLMASDAKDVLTALDWTRRVTVELDDHHDSDIINSGLAADAGYLGTFAHEADQDLDELRVTFQRKAHTAAMERASPPCCARTRSVRSSPSARPGWPICPADDATASLLRRRVSIGLSTAARELVMVDRPSETGTPPDAVPMTLRRARSARISVDGNAHFCRGLLRTRYLDGGSETMSDPAAPRTHPRRRNPQS